ncbi:MAG: pilus (MSHA type) biogenesis protein MshL [Methylococcales bacterium]|jgi:MSHA biogenesis protein MshL|nr:pilus (MSHA type) biogenesis protein MshL [Methylococcales bacterium]
MSCSQHKNKGVSDTQVFQSNLEKTFKPEDVDELETKMTPIIEPPKAVQDALLPNIHLEAIKNTAVYKEAHFDISVTETPAQAFFMSLVSGTQYNMIVHPSVAGQISLTLNNVTIPEVMESLRDVYGYEYSKKGRTYRVLPIRLQSKIYKINYLNIKRNGTSETKISTGDSSGGESSGGSASGGGNQITTTTQSDFWKELEDSLKAILGINDDESNDETTTAPATTATTSPAGNLTTTATTLNPTNALNLQLPQASNEPLTPKLVKSVVVSPLTGLVIIRALPSDIREVEQYISRVQYSINKQVILEAKILEVTLNDGFQSGINWGAIGNPDGGRDVLFSQTGGGSFFRDGLSENASNNGSLNPRIRNVSVTGQENLLVDALTGENQIQDILVDNSTQITNSNVSAFGGIFSAAITATDFTAFVELLKTQGSVQTLSSPRISTVNNQKAVIKVGREEYFVTSVTGVSVNNGGNSTVTEQPEAELERFFSGIALDVTPQIAEDNTVVLHVHPTVTDISEKVKQVPVGSATLPLPLALSNVRESDSIIRAKNNQIVVIGGLMQTIKEDNSAATPFLSDIPILGNLFKHKKDRAIKSELVILIKPIVVGGNSHWQNEIQKSYQNVKQWNQQEKE